MVPERDLIVVAASAGGLQPLRTLLLGLPADLPAAVLVVMHIPAVGSRLPNVLDRAGPLPAAAAIDGEPVCPGRVYLAPPDHHLLIVKDTVRLSRGPRQNGFRPAADPLFRSAALYGGPRVIAVVLSGSLDDAALGSATVERLGGCVIVQDPEEADHGSMPRSALAATERAVAVPADALADQVVRLVAEKTAQPLPDLPEPDEELAAEIRGLLEGNPETDTRSRGYSDLICPECGGPLYATRGQRPQTYDCLIGHRWSPRSLFESQGNAVDRALWLAVRALEERARLAAKLAKDARDRGHVLSAGHFEDSADEARQSADAIRQAVNRPAPHVACDPGEA